MLTKEEIDRAELYARRHQGSHATTHIDKLIAHIREQDAALAELRAENARLTSEDTTLTEQMERQFKALAEARELWNVMFHFFAELHIQQHPELTEGCARCLSIAESAEWLAAHPAPKDAPLASNMDRE